MKKELIEFLTDFKTWIFIAGILIGITINKLLQPTPEPEVIISENRVEVIKEVPTVVEKIVGVEVVKEVPVERKVETVLTQEEKELIARLVQAEAGSESYIGKRLVVDVILNRVDHEKFGTTVSQVVYAPSQFTRPASSFTDECLKAVEAECYERLDYDILYFRANYFFSGHDQAYQHGGHFFSYPKDHDKED